MLTCISILFFLIEYFFKLISGLLPTLKEPKTSVQFKLSILVQLWILTIFLKFYQLKFHILKYLYLLKFFVFLRNFVTKSV